MNHHHLDTILVQAPHPVERIPRDDYLRRPHFISHTPSPTGTRPHKAMSRFIIRLMHQEKLQLDAGNH